MRLTLVATLALATAALAAPFDKRVDSSDVAVDAIPTTAATTKEHTKDYASIIAKSKSRALKSQSKAAKSKSKAAADAIKSASQAAKSKSKAAKSKSKAEASKSKAAKSRSKAAAEASKSKFHTTKAAVESIATAVVDPTTTEADSAYDSTTTVIVDPATTKPEPTTTESEPTTTESEPTTTESEPTTTESEPTTTESESTTTEPESTTTEPETTTTTPKPETTTKSTTTKPVASTTSTTAASGAATVPPVSAPSGSNVEDGVYVSCNKAGVFALTFDDGPFEYSWDLAKSLNEQGIPATFFINGKNWVNVETDYAQTSDGRESYMNVIKHYKDMGHEVGSHTYEHKELAGLTAAEIEYQMNTESDIIYEALGVRPAFMRPPGGSYDDNALTVLRNLGYRVITWDIDTQDWKTHNQTEEEAAYKQMDDDSSGILGHITLEHEVYSQTVNELIPWAIDYIKSKGYKFVTMSECLGLDPYYT